MNNSIQLNTAKMFGGKTNVKVGCLVFVTEANEHFFCDVNGKYFNMDNVWGLSAERNYDNGTNDLPRPYVIEKDGIKEIGDNLVYSFIDEAEQNILVHGSLTSYKVNSLDASLKIDTTKKDGLSKKYLSRSNKQRFFSVYDDAAGNVTIVLKGKEDADAPGTGDLAIKVTGTDGHGNLNLSLNGKFVINQTQIDGETETVIAQILMDSTKDAERIKVIDKYKNRFEFTKDGIVVKDKSANLLEMNATGVILETATIRIGKTDETVAKLLLDLITQIRAMTQGTASGGPTIAPPFNDVAFQAIVARITEFMDVQ